MYIGLQIGLTTRPGNRVGVVNPLAPKISNPGALSGAVIGVETTVSGVSYTGAGASESYRWFLNGALIPGATAASYTPQPADDLKLLRRELTVTNIEGSARRLSAGVIVRYAAPSAAGALPDVDFDEQTGPQDVPTAADFTGDNLTFSLAPPLDIATIHPATGVVTVSTDEVAPPVAVTVKATNSGGNATSSFDVEVLAVPPVADADHFSAPFVFQYGSGDQFIDVAAAFAGTHLTFSVTGGAGAWIEIDQDTGLATIHTNNGLAPTNITVTATNSGGSDSVTFSIEVEVEAPALVNPLSNRSFMEGSGPWTVNAAAAFSGEDLDFELTANGGGNASIDAAGLITITTGALVSAAAVTVRASNFGGEAFDSFDLTIFVSPPQLTGTAIADQAFTKGTGSHDVATAAAFSGSNLSFAVAPAGTFATINSGTGVVSIATASAIAETTVTVTATNASGSVQRSFKVRVNHVAPALIGSIAEQNFTESTGPQTVQAAAAFTGEALAFSLPGSPAIATINPATGEITIRTDLGPGGYVIHVQAANTGGAASASFAVNIGIAAPQRVGTISDRTYSVGDSVAPFSVADVFTGTGRSYAIVPTSPYVTIDSATGVVSVATDAPVPPTTITVRASNAAGSDDAAFTLQVNVLAPTLIGNGLESVTYVEKTDFQYLEAAPHFTGLNLDFEITAGGFLATIDAVTGRIRISTDSIVSGVLVRVVASNEVGSAEDVFSVTVEAISGGSARWPQGFAVAARGGGAPGEVYACFTVPTFWGDGFVGGDNLGAAGNLYLLGPGETSYALIADGPGGEPDLPEIDLDDARGLGIGDAEIGASFIVAPVDQAFFDAAMAGAACVVVDTGLTGPADFFVKAVNDHGVESPIFGTPVVIPAPVGDLEYDGTVLTDRFGSGEVLTDVSGDPGVVLTLLPWSVDLTSPAGLFQDTAGTIPVTAHGQNVRRIETADFAATWVSGTATWQPEGLAVAGGARWDLDDVKTVAGMVVACTPSVGDTSPNHGIIGSATEYVTVADGTYRWRTAADSTGWGVPDAVLSMQMASFAVDGSGNATYWVNGVSIPNDAQPGKAPLTTISRLFHRSTTVSYEGTLAYIALSPTPYSDDEREALQSAASVAASASWSLAGRTLFTPAGVPLITEILGADDPAKPILISHHGLGAKTDGDTYNAGNFASTYALQAFSPWFDNRFSSDAYQKGGYAWLEAPMVEAFRAHLEQPAKPVLIYGHSAGGQWVSRVAAYAPVSNVQRYVVANPSTWVFPDDRAYPFGFGHLAAGAVRNAAIAAYLALPLTVYIGELDTATNAEDNTVDGSTEAQAQGNNRHERATNVFAAAQIVALSLNVPLNWIFVEAAGVGHSGGGMLNSSARADAFFPNGAP